jgi:cellulose synthase/poly-beta-1,6-N-acetylglucosamine synthase-like glycosyltransferase
MYEMTQLSGFLTLPPFNQVLLYILTCSSFIWLITGLLAIKQKLTSVNSFQKHPSIQVMKYGLPKVTVIIPARNEEKYIKRCINSLLAQSYHNLEILVINDNSSDKTADILNSIKNSKIRVITLKEVPRGWARKAWACQVGFSNSAGKLILFTDADTIYFDKNAILNSVTEIEKNSAKVTTGMPLLELTDFYSKMVMPLLNLFTD